MDLKSASNDYQNLGYALLDKFIPPEVATGFLAKMKSDFARSQVDFESLKKESPLLHQAAVEIYGYHYAPMTTFLWGMTPAIQALTGCDLQPTYSYFRIYRKGDILRVHLDRPSCEHSVSLLLASSDSLPWAFDIGNDKVETPKSMADEDFADRPFTSLEMQAGDAVLYQGVHRHHGRIVPNPNRWSAHLFLHWVEKTGAYADAAFDGQRPPASVDF